MIEPIEKKKRRSKAQIAADKAAVEKALAETIAKAAKPKRVMKPRVVQLAPVVEPVAMTAPILPVFVEIPTPTIQLSFWQKVKRFFTS